MTIKTFSKTVHGILAESYMMYVILMLIGILAHSVFRGDIIGQNVKYLGFLSMLLGPLLISAAQRASSKFRQARLAREVGPTDFMYGPYKLMQSPTHIGLFLLSFGFAVVLNSVSLIITTAVAYLITRLFFIPREQKALKRKYGAVYEVYLKKVKLFI